MQQWQKNSDYQTKHSETAVMKRKLSTQKQREFLSFLWGMKKPAIAFSALNELSPKSLDLHNFSITAYWGDRIPGTDRAAKTGPSLIPPAVVSLTLSVDYSHAPLAFISLVTWQLEQGTQQGPDRKASLDTSSWTEKRSKYGKKFLIYVSASP